MHLRGGSSASGRRSLVVVAAGAAVLLYGIVRWQSHWQALPRQPAAHMYSVRGSWLQGNERGALSGVSGEGGGSSSDHDAGVSEDDGDDPTLAGLWLGSGQRTPLAVVSGVGQGRRQHRRDDTTLLQRGASCSCTRCAALGDALTTGGVRGMVSSAALKAVVAATRVARPTAGATGSVTCDCGGCTALAWQVGKVLGLTKMQAAHVWPRTDGNGTAPVVAQAAAPSREEEAVGVAAAGAAVRALASGRWPHSTARRGAVFLDAGVRYAIDSAADAAGGDDKPGAVAKAAPRYSSVRCVGGSGYAGQANDRACLIRNACHVKGGRAWRLFRDATTVGVPVLWDGNAAHASVSDNLVSRGSYSWIGEWDMDSVAEPVPADAAFHPARRAVANHFQGGYYESLNFGHFMGDGLFPTFAVQVTLGLQPSAAVVLVDSPKADRNPRPFPKFWAMAAGLGRGGIIPEINAADTVCFHELVIGTGPFGFMFTGQLAALTGESFRTFMLSGLAVAQPARRAHRVVLLEKSRSAEGRSAMRGRHVVNHDGAVAYLRAAFAGSGVDIVSVVPDELSIADQLALAGSATVCVTPPGGGSFFTWFLPPGAAALYLDVWGGLDGNWGQVGGERSVRYALDDNLWGRFNYVSDMHYPICSLAEMEVGKTRHMDGADMYLVPPRLALLVRAALAEVERRIPPAALARAALPDLLPRLPPACAITPNTSVFVHMAAAGS